MFAKKIRFYTIALTAILCCGNYASAEKKPAKGKPTVRKPTIAVFDFTVSETVTGEITIETNSESRRVRIKRDYKTSLLTDKLVTALVKAKKVSVVERKKLASLRQETELGQAGLTDPGRSVKLGKLLGADYFLLGSLSMLDGKVSYRKLPYDMGQQEITELLVGADIRIVDTETGRIISAKSEKVKMTKRQNNPTGAGGDISVEFQHKAYDQLVDMLVARVIDTLFPIKVAHFSADVVYLNRGGITPGAKYEVLELGEKILDPDTGEVLGQSESKLAIVEVTDGLEKLSKGKVTVWLTEKKTITKGALCRVLLTEEEAEAKKKQLSESAK